MKKIHAHLMREKEEPTEGFSPVPMMLIFLFAGLMFWAGLYLATNSGGFRPDVFDPNWQPTAQPKDAGVAFDPIKRGTLLFKNNCAQCHQMSGEGVPGAYPPLDKSEWVLGSEDRLIRVLLLGMSGPLEVEGKAFNGNMPSFGQQFKDRDIAAILTYIRQSWNNKGSPIDEEKVAEIRKALGARKTPWKPEELLKEFPMGS